MINLWIHVRAAFFPWDRLCSYRPIDARRHDDGYEVGGDGGSDWETRQDKWYRDYDVKYPATGMVVMYPDVPHTKTPTKRTQKFTAILRDGCQVAVSQAPTKVLDAWYRRKAQNWLENYVQAQERREQADLEQVEPDLHTRRLKEWKIYVLARNRQKQLRPS